MDWKTLWISLFGTTELFGVNMGFWVSYGAILLLVILQNAVLWGMKPRRNKTEK